MKVHESIKIAAPPQTVWAHVANPQAMADWHVKLVEVRRTGTGPVYAGERFGTTYIMSRKKQNRQQVDAEVLRCEPWSTLVLRHHRAARGTWMKRTNFRYATKGGRRWLSTPWISRPPACRCGCERSCGASRAPASARARAFSTR